MGFIPIFKGNLLLKTLQLHQKNLTNARVPKSFWMKCWWSMRIFLKKFLWVTKRIGNMWQQYYCKSIFMLGWSKLHLNFSSLNRDGCDNHRFSLKSHDEGNFLLGNLDDNTILCRNICQYQSHPHFNLKSYNVVQITLVWNIFMVYYYYYHICISYSFSNSSKYASNFFIDCHYETKAETSDSVAVVGILWCSCRVFYFVSRAKLQSAERKS